MAVYYEQRSNVMIISWRDFTWLFLDLRNTRFLMTLAGDVINKKIRKHLTHFTYSFTAALSLPIAGAVLNYDLTWQPDVKYLIKDPTRDYWMRPCINSYIKPSLVGSLYLIDITHCTYFFTTALSLPLAGAVLNSDFTNSFMVSSI